jgi:multisubunit Na+/H+ antiporter MnhE subunit
MKMNQLTIRHFTYPIVFAVIWMLMTDQIGLISFGIGYLLSFVVNWLLLSTLDEVPTHHRRNLPLRVLLVIGYLVRLNWEIILSGFDVFLRIVGARPIRAGIVAVPVQDPDDDQVVAGLSAHSITITPGQLVVAYDRDGKTLYVHCLDVESMAPTLEVAQAKRMRMFRRMLGLD